MPQEAFEPSSGSSPSGVEGSAVIPEKIINVKARQVLDSRGNPTVEVDLWTQSGVMGRATIPSGASTGIHEAVELRDGDPKVFGGKSVLKAVSNVNSVIKPRILGLDCTDQVALDRLMILADGTSNKSNLGANSILGVSMSAARAASAARNQSLFQYLIPRPKYALPVPMMNVINGGKHAGNSLSIQEFLIEPLGGGSFSEALRFGTEIYQKLRTILKDKHGVSSTNIGDEGGYAPPLSSTLEALELILSAISSAGYDERQIRMGLDAAASSFYDKKSFSYLIDGRKYSGNELHDYYGKLVSTYPIFTLEDPFSEDDFGEFANMTKRLGSKIKIIGDDLYVTNTERIKRGIVNKSTNAILIKLNQIGTLTEAMEAIKMSKEVGFMIVVSHRSGETEDTFISHLAVAVESQFIKTGAPARGERTAKYNELLRIEEQLGTRALFAGDEL